MTTEVYEPALRPAPDAVTVATLPAGEQVQWLAHYALELSDSRGVQAQACVVQELRAALPTQLSDEAAALPRYDRLERLSELGKQHARAGNEETAHALRAQATDPTFTDPADEITLAVMEHRLASGQVFPGRISFTELSHNMRAWGVIKLQKYGLSVCAWHEEAYALEKYWRQYNIRQQQEIINELLVAGDTPRALHFARQIAPPVHSHPTERRAQEDTIIRIAHYQARRGDVHGGLEILTQLEADAEEALNQDLERGMFLPEHPANDSEAAALRQHAANQAEHTRTYNLARMHAIALRAHQSVRFAVSQLEIASFYGDDHRRIFHTMARRVLASTLANIGAVHEAVAVASGIDEQDGDKLFRQEKAFTFLDIARAVRRRRHQAAA
jgi:hypothetical protein